tara:strand:+ start:472 stop:1119 length:648 start_codon:yes stop_codon:yes gene_type:complete
MIKMSISFMIILYHIIHAINFHPLPKSFTNTIRLSQSYGVFKFKNINLTAAGGTQKDSYEIIGLGLKWGPSFKGWLIDYGISQSALIQSAGSDLVKTTMALDMFKLRGFFPLIEDQSSLISLFGSFGRFTGNYMVVTQSESDGITQLKQRFVGGVLFDLGVGFNYKINPEWDVFLQVLYQWSIDETITDILGSASSDPRVDMTGAMLQLGTALRL